ncbi:MAG: DUF6505 family protein [Hyphomicrobiaceae bacterium]
MKLLRTVRFDASDARVYEPAAEPGEWAVSGAFAFQAREPADVTGKAHQAFANGFFALTSFGWSTFAVVAEAKEAEVTGAVDALAGHLVAVYGAPDIAAARPAAREEIDFAAELVRDAPINTVFTVRRTRDATGAITEEFRTIRPPSAEPQHARIWTIEPDAT